MADFWELICHHTYVGIPGVVVDVSPRAISHGQVVGLNDGDFLTDGTVPGSGAVRFYRQDGRIRISTEASPWRSIVGVKGEVTLRRQQSHGFIIDSDSFQFHVRGNSLDIPVAWFSSHPNQYAEISTLYDSVGPQPYRIPTGPWVTLGFMHDGFGTMELYAEGQVIARRNGVYGAVKAPGAAGLSIGNALRSNGLACNGEIDEVKIWRLNPRRIDDEFYARPVDPATAECWRRLRSEIDQALRSQPECRKQLGSLFIQVVESLRRQAIAQGPETESRMLRAAREYNRLWRGGQVDSPEMADVFLDLINWLRIAGVAPENNEALATLQGSRCWQLLLSKLTPPDCDHQLMALLRMVIGNLGGRTKG